ncbi:hypothetical protein MKW92_028282 [Papaver armeniacum]|nr:hypothetical protein MKW92_028282 [Papaver armeniacum]
MAKGICFLVMIMMIASMVVDARHLLANTGGLGDTTGALLGNTNPGGLQQHSGVNVLAGSNTKGVNVLGNSNTGGLIALCNKEHGGVTGLVSSNTGGLNLLCRGGITVPHV